MASPNLPHRQSIYVQGGLGSFIIPNQLQKRCSSGRSRPRLHHLDAGHHQQLGITNFPVQIFPPLEIMCTVRAKQEMLPRANLRIRLFDLHFCTSLRALEISIRRLPEFIRNLSLSPVHRSHHPF